MSGGFDDDDYDDEREPTRRLSKEESWERLGSVPFGRIATTAAGEVDIFPVNHAVDDGQIVFRTSPGSKLLEILVNPRVAFEVDGWDDVRAWSVVVKGEAFEFSRQAEVVEAEELGLRAWAPEEKERWVRIRPSEVHGREFER